MKRERIWLAGLMILGLAASAQAKVLYQDDFSNWRDEKTDPGFNATHEVDKEKGIVTVKTGSDINFGKVMTAEGGITATIDEGTTVSFKLLADIPKGDIKIHLMTAGEPYDSHEAIRAYKAGEYSATIASKTPWTGKHTFWLEIWLEGFDRIAKITDVKITDGKAEEAAPEATKKKPTVKKRTKR
jgi:hypothetical protein